MSLGVGVGTSVGADVAVEPHVALDNDLAIVGSDFDADDPDELPFSTGNAFVFDL